MRISVIGKQYADSYARNIVFALRSMGHQVQDIDPSAIKVMPGLPPRVRKLLTLLNNYGAFQKRQKQTMLRNMQAFRPELIINNFANLQPDIVTSARNTLKESKIVFIYPDANANLGREYPFAVDYDALFFKDPYAVELFRTRLNINAVYLPQGCNPEWHRSVEISSQDMQKYGCDLTTVGNMYYYRARMLEPFADYDIKIWGNSWPSWLQSPLRSKYPGIYVAELEKAKALQAAKIVLNTLSHKEVEGVNLRTFEVAGCGGFQIADWRPDMERLFKPDEEIILFHSQDELVEKVDYYLHQPEKRKKIAEAGQRRAHRDHTIVKRMEQLLQVAHDV